MRLFQNFFCRINWMRTLSRSVLCTSLPNGPGIRETSALTLQLPSRTCEGLPLARVAVHNANLEMKRISQTMSVLDERDPCLMLIVLELSCIQALSKLHFGK